MVVAFLPSLRAFLVGAETSTTPKAAPSDLTLTTLSPSLIYDPTEQCFIMGMKHTDHLQRICADMPPPKQLTPGKVRKSISVAPLFNRQKETSSFTKKQELSITTLRSVAETQAKGLARHSKIRSSSQAPHKVGKSLQKRSDMHPLAIAFKSVSLTVVQCADSIIDAVQIQPTTTASISTRTPL